MTVNTSAREGRMPHPPNGRPMIRMSRLARGLLVALACAASGAATQAADLGTGKVRNAPPPEIYYEPGYNWSGLYYGASVGGAFATTGHQYDRLNGPASLESSGAAFSGHLGYNLMMPSLWVFGVEIELGHLGIESDQLAIGNGDILSAGAGLFGTARARLGYAFGRFLPYVTAGAAFVDIETAGGNPANDNRFLTLSEIQPGLAVGAGAEYAFGSGLVARLEYLYIDVAEYEGRNLENELMKFDNDIHLVRAGLSYKF